ncbi:MAG: hypothetical protein KME21_01695 [Desmonostoc vinosum HA7617-LM4]|jgi:hypothetical protein|nr:hypothetical protein [Desmonostoc vinosum HA7617-LM4]
MRSQQLLKVLLVTGSVWLSIAINAFAQQISSKQAQGKSVAFKLFPGK